MPVGTYFLDADKDGYGTGAGQSGCGSAGGYTALLNGDCNDADASINPGGTEVCNSKDDNCNGQVDEIGGCQTCTATLNNPLDTSYTDTINLPGAWWAKSYHSTQGSGGMLWGDSTGCGYFSGSDTLKFNVKNIPNGAKFVLVDVYFDNNNKAAATSADTTAKMVLTWNGQTQTVGPFATVQTTKWRTLAWPVPQSAWGSSLQMDVTMSATVSSTGCHGGFAVDYVRTVAGCSDLSNFCAPANAAGLLGQQTWYQDLDGDGYGVTGATISGCGMPAGYAASSGDCDDTLSTVNPGAVEICDALDNDCNGATDELTGAVLNPLEGYANYTTESVWWTSGISIAKTQGSYAEWAGDSAGCGYPKLNDTVTFPITVPSGVNGVALDLYFDNRLKVNPDVADTSAKMTVKLNGVTQTIGPFSSVQNPKWRTLVFPMTAADYGKAYTFSVNVTTATSNTPYSNYTPCGTSGGGFAVDNARSLASCGVSPACTAGVTASNWFLDGDGDGFGDPATSVSACIQPAGYVPTGGDCDDQNAAVNPGVAKDSCNTAAIDDNCDGVTDGVGSTGCTAMYPDVDGDTFGSKTAASVCYCGAPTGYVADKTDCNDTNSAIKPGAGEVCNGLDDNCDGATDPVNTSGCQPYFTDVDKDGYGTGASQCWCSAQVTYSTLIPGDCVDNNAAINPGKTETCNSVDDDCNTLIDDGLPQGTWYKDADGDKFGAAAPQFIGCQVVGYVADNTDCNDAAVSIYPGATETCNLKDDNCDGATDEGLNLGTWNRDADGDGFGDAGTQLMNSCMLPGYVATYGDCDDTKVAVNPGVAEVCYNKIDDNCDGATDEGCPACQPTLINGFESMLNVTWTGSQWGKLSTPHTEGTYAIGWTSLFNGGGNGYYSTSGTGEYMYVNATVPNGTVFVKADIYLGNRSLGSVDTNMVVTPTLAGVLPTGGALGPYATYQGSTNLKTVVWAIAPSQWNTTVQFKVNVSTNVTSADSLGYVMVDNLRTTCN